MVTFIAKQEKDFFSSSTGKPTNNSTISTPQKFKNFQTMTSNKEQLNYLTRDTYLYRYTWHLGTINALACKRKFNLCFETRK